MLLPLKVDVPMDRRPWVNYLLIAAICAVSIRGFADDDLVCRLGGVERPDDSLNAPQEIREALREWRQKQGIPDEPSKPALQPLPKLIVAITSTFVHADWGHLVGNLWFLWLFGNAVNYKICQLPYLALFLVCGFASSLAHSMFISIPSIGASGAIYGIMGVFIVFFPLNDVKMAGFFWVVPMMFRLSSIWIVLGWVAWDALWLYLGVYGGVALWAHVGGFCVGLATGLILAATHLIVPTEDEQTILQIFFPPARASVQRSPGWQDDQLRRYGPTKRI